MSFRGHTTLTARLAPAYAELPDVAGFAAQFRRDFDLDVFAPDSAAKPGYGEYDPGRDAVTESLLAQTVWEAQESTLAADILAQTAGVVLDFGAHIGWYTVLAALFGAHPVIAFEEHEATREVLEANIRRHSVAADLRPGVTASTTPFAHDSIGEVALMKCDIEGAEDLAVDACAELFADHRIRYALIEISPIFTADGRSNCDYVAMTGQLLDWGYHLFRIPPKGWEHNDEYREQPVATLIRRCAVGADWPAVIAGCRQDNFVFIRSEDAA
ncbi:hypothetical protein NONO_c60590 [Nocardia nova SH22a]|uniref:Methyltransferase, FkbM family n=1 Tax=Nocardia nova SH22a TaxID=1415166 RepID=W5TNB3_9NOCA|nr:hypothetical protein [Nocardia nova]AHH20835.1 hypothetical protein NONO_c60590 [Nocardia nova SH22a]